MAKTGLVLEGGGMRGLFTAGILDVLMENNVTFDGVVGVSAGATFGCNFISHQIGRTLRYNMSQRKNPKYMGIRSLIKTGDYVGGEYAYHVLPTKLDVFDFEAFEKNPTEFHVVTTNVRTGEAIYHRIDKVDYTGMEWIRASASMPIISRPVAIGDYEMLDGGIADSIPLRYFESEGFKRNIVILTQPKGFKKKLTKLMPVFKATMRKYPAIIEGMSKRHLMYNRELDYITQQQMAGKCLVICPSDTLPIGRTSLNAKKMQYVYDMGRKAGKENLETIKHFIEKN
jgi:predicted patatin/cPLA2 family phospholipase